jgi:hypothetical protein
MWTNRNGTWDTGLSWASLGRLGCLPRGNGMASGGWSDGCSLESRDMIYVTCYHLTKKMLNVAIAIFDCPLCKDGLFLMSFAYKYSMKEKKML